MKLRYSATFVLASALGLLQTANAGVECLTKASAQLTTKDNHCAKHCSNWDKDVPPQTVTLLMPEQFKAMGAFFRNPASSCSGATCGWSAFPPIGAGSPTRIDYTFRHWSKPAIVTITADVCVYSAATPPTPPATNPTPNPGPTPAPRPPDPTPPAVPPQKDHAVREAGPMTPDDCSRMSSNWKVDARNYCSPYNVNLAQTNLACKSDADNLGRSVSGIFLCMK